MSYTTNRKKNPKKFRYSYGIAKDKYYFSNKKEADNFAKKEHFLYKSDMGELF